MDVQNKNANWLGWRIFDLLSPQMSKIKYVLYVNDDLGRGGWEGWAQLEMAYGLCNYMRALVRAKAASGDELVYDIVREWDYPGKAQRFDFYLSGVFLTAAQNQGWMHEDYPNSEPDPPWDPMSRSEYYFVELKCQGASEEMEAFVSRVNKDLDKIEACDPQGFPGTQEGRTHLAIWMIAITRSTREEEDEKMYDLETRSERPEELEFTWQVIPLPGLGFSKIWTRCINLKGNPEDSLFAYST